MSNTDRFPALHSTDKSVAVLDYTAGQTVTKTLQLQNRYEYITGFLSLTLAAGAASVSAAQEGALAIIERLYVTVNGAQAGKYETSGKHLFIRAFEDSRKEPMGHEPLTNAAKTYNVYFQWRFAPSNIAQADIFALDLLKENGNDSLLSNAEVSVSWGTEHSLFHDAGGVTVVNAQLRLEGSQTMLPALGGGRAYNRANEMIVRQLTKTFTAADETLEIEIPRLNLSFLAGITVAQYARKAANGFDDNTKSFCLKNDEYKWKSPSIGVHRSRQNIFLDDAPSNMIFIPLTEKNDISTAMPDAAFTDNLKLEIPVNVGATSDACTLEVFSTFVTRAKVN